HLVRHLSSDERNFNWHQSRHPNLLGELQGDQFCSKMDNMKDGGSFNKPPVLDGSNYDYWKARMVAFLKSMDSKSWKAIVKGWTHQLQMEPQVRSLEQNGLMQKTLKLLATLKHSMQYSMVLIKT
ncbi:gag-pol polyprotein, partial [Trifolium medium]|nr:gag-pol polyprotein [Trifolium medium]